MVPQEVTRTFQEAHDICRNYFWELISEPSYESYFRVSWFDHPAYSSDLPLSNFCLIPKIKSSIKWLRSFTKPVSLETVNFLTQQGMSGLSLATQALARHFRNAWSVFSCEVVHSIGLFPTLSCLIHIAGIKTFAFFPQVAFGIK